MATIQDLISASPLPRLETRLLLQQILKVNHAWLIAHNEHIASEQQRQDFLALVQRRVHGEPIAYILGQREFYGLPFIVNEQVLIPRPETELLVDIAQEILSPDKKSRVLDLGTGSGVIAITIAKICPNVAVYATDQSASALRVAQKNAEQHQVDIYFSQGDWFEAISPIPFDLIVSNPPYIIRDDPHLSIGDLRFEPRAALTDESLDGLAHIRCIIAKAPDYLANGGALWIEHGYDQAHACRALLEEYGFGAVKSVKDLNQIERASGGVRL